MSKLQAATLAFSGIGRRHMAMGMLWAHAACTGHQLGLLQELPLLPHAFSCHVLYQTLAC